MINDDQLSEEYYASQRILGKTYFSQAFTPSFRPLKERFAHKILDYEGTEYLLKDEKTLGITYSGKRQLKALFFQESRLIDKLIIQQFSEEGNPIKNKRNFF